MSSSIFLYFYSTENWLGAPSFFLQNRGNYFLKVIHHNPYLFFSDSPVYRLFFHFLRRFYDSYTSGSQKVIHTVHICSTPTSTSTYTISSTSQRGVSGVILPVFTSSGLVFRSILYNISILEYFDLFYFFDVYDVLLMMSLRLLIIWLNNRIPLATSQVSPFFNSVDKGIDWIKYRLGSSYWWCPYR